MLRSQRRTERELSRQDEQNHLLWKGFETFLNRTTSSLFELGLWVFGSLMAFNLLILASLFTIGPVDLAVRIATAAFAAALPLNVTGLVLLKLVHELKDVKLDDQLAQAFLDVGYTGEGQVPSRPALSAMRRGRTAMVLRTFPGVLAVSVLLTLTGMLATLWHMALWISGVFVAVVALSLLLVFLVAARSGPTGKTST